MADGGYWVGRDDLTIQKLSGDLSWRALAGKGSLGSSGLAALGWTSLG